MGTCLFYKKRQSHIYAPCSSKFGINWVPRKDRDWAFNACVIRTISCCGSHIPFDSSPFDVRDNHGFIFSLACGTTWHAAGLVSRHKFSPLESAITQHSSKLYQQLEKEGYHTGTYSEVYNYLILFCVGFQD